MKLINIKESSLMKRRLKKDSSLETTQGGVKVIFWWDGTNFTLKKINGLVPKIIIHSKGNMSISNSLLLLDHEIENSRFSAHEYIKIFGRNHGISTCVSFLGTKYYT